MPHKTKRPTGVFHRLYGANGSIHGIALCVSCVLADNIYDLSVQSHDIINVRKLAAIRNESFMLQLGPAWIALVFYRIPPENCRNSGYIPVPGGYI